MAPNPRDRMASCARSTPSPPPRCSPFLGLSGCGYHTLGAATHLPPDVKTLAVPVFATRTDSNGTETALTQAVVREFITRTRFRVTTDSGADADAVLHGTILKQTVTPLTYNAATQQSSSFVITIVASVSLTAHDGRVLYENKNYVLPRAIPVHHRPADLYSGGSGSHPAAFARVCAAACGRYPGRALTSRRHQSDSKAKNATRFGQFPNFCPVFRAGVFPRRTVFWSRMISALHGHEAATVSGARWGAGFAAAGRFVAEIEAAQAGTGKLRPGYALLGDEAFLLDRCRAAVLKAFVPDELRDFSLSDLDLASTSIFEVLDRAQTPSLMAPFQVIFVRNVRQLYTRGAKKDEFAALDRYFQSPNPQALLLFVADFIRIPADARRMEMDDKNRNERLKETLGEHCGMVELARVSEEDAMRWAAATAQQAGSRLEPDAARELVDALGADMMLVASELEKLLLYASGRGKITLGDVETMVLAAKQRSLYELTDAISAHDRVRALALLQGLLNSSDAGEDAAIGHLYMLARTFRQMLVILEKNVRDSRAIWQALWQGFRMPPFAADDLIRQARRYKSRRELTRALRLVARADLELRSSPPDKRLVLERLIYELASEPKPAAPAWISPQLSFES